jgi:hypothetical protein
MRFTLWASIRHTLAGWIAVDNLSMRKLLWASIRIHVVSWILGIAFLLYGVQLNLLAYQADPNDESLHGGPGGGWEALGLACLLMAWLLAGACFISAMLTCWHDRPWPRLLWGATVAQLVVPTGVLTALFVLRPPFMPHG